MRKLLLIIGFLVCVSSLFAQISWTAGKTPAQVRTAFNTNFDSLYALTKNTTSSTRGVIYRDGVRFIHNYPGTNFGGPVDATYGGKNNFIGRWAGNFTLTGAMNTALGDSNLVSLTSGSLNTAIGAQSLMNVTTGHANTAVGRAAMRDHVSNGSNTAVGESAMERDISGSNNTAVGTNAMMFNRGSNNTAVGCHTLSADLYWPIQYITGDFNSAFGDGALGYVTTGTENTGIGVGAGALTSTGSYNTFVGSQAGTQNTTGIGNTIIGRTAAYGISGFASKGNYNTVIGFSAFPSDTAGSFNVAIGMQAGYFETGSNKLYIDNATRANEADGRLKALIYGVFDVAVANQRLTINGRLIIPQISAALTDGAPTDTEIDTATGLIPSTAGAGFKVTIKDNNGSGLLYLIESSGTDWFYTVMTKAIN